MMGGSKTFVDAGAPALDVILTAIDAAGFQLGPSHHVQRIALDTFDGRIRSAGLRLEHHSASGGRLVLSGDRSVPAHLPTTTPPRRASDLAPGLFRSRVERASGVRALLPCRRVTATATAALRRNGDGKVVASATIFEQVTADGAALDTSWAIEVVPLDGYDKATGRLVAMLEQLGLRSEPGDLLDVAGPAQAPGEAVASPTIPLDAAAPAFDGFRAVLAHLATTIDVNLPGAIDDTDPEFLHDLRIAVRRTRAVLSHAKLVLPADVAEPARASFRWLGAITGPARDLDVYQLEWSGYVRGLPATVRDALEDVRTQLERQRRDAHDQLAAELAGTRATEMLANWRRWLGEPAEPGPPADPRASAPTAEVIGGRIQRAQRRLVDAGRAIEEDSPADELHELRKDAKQLRYLLECFGGLYDPSARKPFVRRLKALQDHLGIHQDADIHAAHLRIVTSEMAPTLPAETMLAAGQLVEQLDQRRAGTRDDFSSWFGDYDCKATRNALATLLATAR